MVDTLHVDDTAVPSFMRDLNAAIRCGVPRGSVSMNILVSERPAQPAMSGSLYSIFVTNCSASLVFTLAYSDVSSKPSGSATLLQSSVTMIYVTQHVFLCDGYLTHS